MKTTPKILFCLAAAALFASGTPAFAAEAAAREAMGKTASMAVIYAVLALLSLALLAGYCLTAKKKDIWLVLLFASVAVVNTGYLALALSRTLEEALLANRIAYLGSVFLPLCMLVILLRCCGHRPGKPLLTALTVVSALIFLLAASGGYLPLYYKDVSLVYINGVARLDKIYGPLHFLYFVYLLVYFASMVAVTVHAIRRQLLPVPAHATLLASIVLGNIGVWLIEQLIYVEFEFLSVTYVISGFFLLMLHRILRQSGMLPENDPPPAEDTPPPESLYDRCLARFPEAASLTAREQEVLRHILENAKRRDIAAQMCVSENTVKKHTSHIFAKLNVSSRSELFALLAAREDAPAP